MAGALSAAGRLVGALLLGLLTLVRLGVVHFTAALEAVSSPSKLPAPALVARAATLAAVAAAALGGLLRGARTVTQLDPAPWKPHAGPGGDVPPPGSPSAAYLSSPYTPTALGGGRRLHHITVATHGDEGLARLARSASWHGNGVRVLGVGDPRLQQWGVGFGVKVENFIAYARSVPPGDLVLFTDAYDVVMWGSHADVAAGYDAAVAAAAAEERDPAAAGGKAADRPPRVLVSAETLPTVWDGVDYGAAWPAQLLTRGHHFPYLNSGAFLAPAGDLIALLTSRAMDMNDNDQAFFSERFLAARANASLPRVALDHGNAVFLTLTSAPPLRETVAGSLVYQPVARRWRHARTGGHPSVFHSPGWVRWKQVDEAWGLAQGRYTAGAYRAASLQWPPLPGLAGDVALSALVWGLAAGLVLPLAAAVWARSSCPRRSAGCKARAAGWRWVGPVFAALCGGGGSGSSHAAGSGGSGAYAPVSTAEH
jgi:hypothetical protein